jgi:hypothetical protein
MSRTWYLIQTIRELVRCTGSRWRQFRIGTAFNLIRERLSNVEQEEIVHALKIMHVLRLARITRPSMTREHAYTYRGTEPDRFFFDFPFNVEVL